MKRDNNLIQITNNKTGEIRYFTKNSRAQAWIGCSQPAMMMVIGNRCPKYNFIRYEIVDGAKVLYENIDNID